MNSKPHLWIIRAPYSMQSRGSKHHITDMPVHLNKYEKQLLVIWNKIISFKLFVINKLPVKNSKSCVLDKSVASGSLGKTSLAYL